MWGKSISLIIFLIAVLSAGAFGLEAAAYEDAGSSDLKELPETSQSLLEFAGQALAYVEENGKERALEEFNYGTDRFVAEDRYITLLSNFYRLI